MHCVQGACERKAVNGMSDALALRSRMGTQGQFQ